MYGYICPECGTRQALASIGVDEQEQEEIQNAPRGQAFTILSPQSRSTFMVDVGPDLTEMFEKEDFESGYFIGRVGR